MRRDLLAAGALLLAAPLAFAQLGTESPDWREADAPPPPALRVDKLVALEIPRATMRYGIDPASVSIGKDGVVRYVVVATSAEGVVNGLYEGIRCGTAEVKLYARHNAGTGWVVAKGSEWRPLHDNVARHSLHIARQGACANRAPAPSAAQAVRELGAPVDRRFITDSMR